MRMRGILVIVMAFMIIIAISCEKSDDTGITLSFKGETSVLKSTNNDGSYTFSEAFLGVHEIEIESEEEYEEEYETEGTEVEIETETEIEYEFEGEYAVDLLTGESDPDMGLAEVQPGTYNELEAEISPILEGGKSIIIKGTYTESGQETIEFEFSTTSEIELEVESDAGFYLDEGSILDLVVTFVLPGLFDGVDFYGAEKNDNGVVIMDDSTNVEQTNKVKSNISKFAELEDDDDD
jgi:hypothetical protein